MSTFGSGTFGSGTFGGTGVGGGGGVDDEASRRASIAVRCARLPWGRRFTTPPSGTAFDAQHRARIAGAYYPSAIEEPPPPPPPVPVPAITYLITRAQSAVDLLELRGLAQRSDTVRWDLVDAAGNILGDLHPDTDTTPVVEVNNGVRTISGFVLPWDQQADVNTLTDRVRPVYVLQNGAEFPLGVGLFADANRVRHSEGLDLHATLVDATFVLDQAEGVSVAYPTGANVGVLLAAEWAASGTADYHVDSTSVTLDEGIGWSPSATRLERMSDLSTLAGFFNPYYANEGRGISRHAAEPGPGSASLFYDGATFARVYPGSIVESDDLLSAPNRWVVISSAGTDAPVVGSYEVPPNAPHSRFRRGFYVTEPISAQGITDPVVAAQMAAAAAVKAPNGHQYVEFDGSPDPRHDVWSVVSWLGVEYLELGWRLVCRPVGPHHHRMRRAFSE